MRVSRTRSKKSVGLWKKANSRKQVRKIKQNPCRYCTKAFEYRGRNSPSHSIECDNCENIKAHKKYLESQRKFVEGEPITSLAELLEQEWVMWYHSTKHIETFKSMPLRAVVMFLDNGAFRKAVRKESEEK